ncbi:MAG: hypothetical protein [Microviridae sp.]|nr:MAG: hypothetical protein [Microviridae sp.]
MARKKGRSRDRRTAARPVQTPQPATVRTVTRVERKQPVRAAPTARPAEPANVGRDKFTVARLKRELPELAKVAHVPIPAAEKRALAQAKPEKRKPPLEIAQDRRCKPRPTKTTGDGTSRPFIPYCK